MSGALVDKYRQKDFVCMPTEGGNVIGVEGEWTI